MGGLKQFFQLYINGSVHVAFSAAALTWLTYLEVGVLPNFKVIGIVFCATIAGYNFIKYFGLASTHHRNITPQIKRILWLSIVSILGILILLVSLKWPVVIVLLMSSLVTFLYARPLGLKNLVIHDQNLREVSGLKIFIIAAVWTSMTVLIPFIDIQISFDQFGWIYLTQRYIFIMALVLPFDIRDTIYDQIRLATIPQILGLIGTKIVGVFGTMIVVFLTFYIDIDIIPMLIACLLLTLSILLSNAKRPFYFTAFWVEGIPLIWLSSLLLSRLD
mgnify:CR=1 FL=1